MCGNGTIEKKETVGGMPITETAAMMEEQDGD